MAETLEMSESTDEKQLDENTPEATAAEGEVETKQAEQAKTFTQEEVDAIVQKRLLKDERRMQRRIEQQLREQQVAKIAEVAPDRTEFKDDEAYLQAQIEHLAEKRAQVKIAERERQQQQERLSESFTEKAEKAAERYPDFAQVVGDPSLPINQDMAEFIAESDLGPDVAYFLGKNPTKAAQIAQMSPVRAARELSRIESEIASKPKAVPSKAPEPINPVGSRSKASSSSLPSDDDNIETWMRKERERARRG